MNDGKMQSALADLDRKLDGIANGLDAIKREKKGFLDVLSALSGLLVAIVGGVFTLVYQAEESKRNQQQQEHNAKIAETQAYGTFIEYLSGTNVQQQKLATVGVSRLFGDQEAASFLSAITNTAVESTKREIAVSENRPELVAPVGKQFLQMMSAQSILPANHDLNVTNAPLTLASRPVDWSQNNLADVNTWALLNSLGQISKSFPQAGKVRVKDFTFWTRSKTGEDRNLVAASLAAQMDKILINIYKAGYEKDVNQNLAISTLRSVLTIKDKSAADVAAAVDRLYAFADTRKD